MDNKIKLGGTGMLLIWDTDKNSEIKNFSINNCEYFTFGNGHDSKIGYIFIKSADKKINHGLYTNLDNCLLNPYFESEFETSKWSNFF